MDYISREAAIKRIKANKKWADSPITMDYVAELLSTLPAADVRVVVKGEWKVYLDGKELMCSVCTATFWDEDGCGGSNFCPNCGADMRGGNNGMDKRKG